MNHISLTSLQAVRRYKALWLYLLIFVVAIMMALFSAWAQAGGKPACKFVIPAKAGIQ